MKVKIEIDSAQLRELVVRYLREKLTPEGFLEESKILIEVKSKQNYREHSWERGEFRATYEGEI